MLGTGFLAFSTLDTIRRLAFPSASVDNIIIIISIPVVMDLLSIHHGKQIRDGDVLGTSRHTVAAGSTGNQIHGMIDFPHLINGLQFLIVQRTEVLHKADVFRHLLHTAHAVGQSASELPPFRGLERIIKTFITDPPLNGLL